MISKYLLNKKKSFESFNVNIHSDEDTLQVLVHIPEKRFAV